MGLYILILRADYPFLGYLGTVLGATTVPTVTDNAWDDGLLTAYEVGISFEPTTAVNVVNGELTFGGVDPSKYTGSIQYVRVLELLS